MTKTEINNILATTRPKFLLLTPCCLTIAISAAILDQTSLNIAQLLLVLTGALTAHISVNMFNEYADFMSELDFNTQRTPFSGGSGSLPSSPELAQPVRTIAIINLLITILIGCYFTAQRGWYLTPIGIVGVALIYFYNNAITQSVLLSLFAPGLAFGPLMINGAYFVLTGHFNDNVVCASLVVFFLVNNLLLLNQFPDIKADKRVGRRNVPILWGEKRASLIYLTFLVAAFSILLLSIRLNYLPITSTLGFITLIFAVPAAWITCLHAEDLEKLKPALALNVLLTLTMPVLLGISFLS